MQFRKKFGGDAFVNSRQHQLELHRDFNGQLELSLWVFTAGNCLQLLPD
jgi:hypothetical protein